jgi:hypothetical protein
MSRVVTYAVPADTASALKFLLVLHMNKMANRGCPRTSSSLECELRIAQQLTDAQKARLNGISGFGIQEFRDGMKEAIKQGVTRTVQ